MKIEHSRNQMIVKGTTRSQDINISTRNSALIEMFLRSQIYSDSIAAVVREYYANAIDEHRKFNVERPVEITCNDNEWSVRDFAEGLPEDKVFFHFFTYGESTKGESDEDMGGFGIGSKAGHSYNTEFFVTSWHNGIETMYAGLLETKDGKPKGRAHVVHSRPSDEPSGIKVSVPIKNGDAHKFADKSEFYAEWSNCPTLVNGDKIEKDPDYCGKNWAANFTNYSSDTWVVVGDIAYKVDESEFRRNGIKLVMYAGIDEIDLALNKEVPKYTDKTKSTLKRLHEESLKELGEQIDKKLEGLNIWERKHELRKFPYTVSQLTSVGSNVVIPTYKKIFNIKSGRVSTYSYPKQLTSSVHVYHHADERLPRNFWKAITEESSVVIQWDSEQEMKNGLATGDFWSLAPDYQKKLVSDVVVPKQTKSVVPRIKTAWRDWGNVHKVRTPWGEEDKISYSPNSDEKSAEELFEKGGYYFYCKRGSMKKSVFENTFCGGHQNIDLFATLCNYCQSKGISVVGALQNNIDAFKKSKKWKPLEDLIGEIINEKSLRIARKICFVESLLRADCKLAHNLSWPLDSRTKFDVDRLLPRDYRTRMSAWKRQHENHYVEFSNRPDFTSNLEKTFSNKLLTKAAEEVYSYIGWVAVNGRQCETRKNKIYEKLKK